MSVPLLLATGAGWRVVGLAGKLAGLNGWARLAGGWAGWAWLRAAGLRWLVGVSLAGPAHCCWDQGAG